MAVARRLAREVRTTDPIESAFSTAKARAKGAKGAKQRQASLTTAFKPLLALQKRWHKTTAPPLTALIRASVTFRDGQRQLVALSPGGLNA